MSSYVDVCVDVDADAGVNSITSTYLNYFICRDMSRERNPKKPDHRYFDTRLVSDVDESGEIYEEFILAYATYVLYRARNFAGK